MSKNTRGPWRISAVVAALSLVLPFVVLFLVAPVNPDALLPACCRRTGQHHCMALMVPGGANAAGSSSPRLARMVERCAYSPGAVSGASNPFVWQPIQERTIGPTQGLRSEVFWDRTVPQMLRDSANLQRGPPAFHISA